VDKSEKKEPGNRITPGGNTRRVGRGGVLKNVNGKELKSPKDSAKMRNPFTIFSVVQKTRAESPGEKEI